LYGWSHPNHILYSLTLVLIPIIICNWAWFTVLLFTSTILLVCSIVNIWFHYHINTPDILGYVSSMAIENSHIPLSIKHPGAKITLDGLERADHLGGLRFRIGDVQSGEAIGKIAFAADGVGVISYKKGRMVI
jgi:hypothetical protein